MSDLESARAHVAGWLEPLGGDAGPCGPDLEYDNAFLALSLAVAGRPESQFAPAEPPDWPGAIEQAEAMFERTRDLRVGVSWVRGMVHVVGIGALAPGFSLLSGLLEAFPEALHPQPDPDDGDPYARVNALAVLRENEGLVGDLREAAVVGDRAIGFLTFRSFELARGLAKPRDDESAPSQEQVAQMLAAAVARQPGLRESCEGALAAFRTLDAALQDKLADNAPDLRPLRLLLEAVAHALPAPATVDDEAAGGGEGAAGEAAGGLKPWHLKPCFTAASQSASGKSPCSISWVDGMRAFRSTTLSSPARAVVTTMQHAARAQGPSCTTIRRMVILPPFTGSPGTDRKSVV